MDQACRRQRGRDGEPCRSEVQIELRIVVLNPTQIVEPPTLYQYRVDCNGVRGPVILMVDLMPWFTHGSKKVSNEKPTIPLAPNAFGLLSLRTNAE